MRFFSIMLLHLIAFNTISGAAAAGTDAMKVFNDWPWFNGHIFPEELKNMNFKLKDLFENKVLV